MAFSRDGDKLIRNSDQTINTLLICALFLSCILAEIICLGNAEKVSSQYRLIILYPMFYAFSALPLFTVLEKKKYRSFETTIGLYLLVQGLRCVVLPVVGVLSDYFSEMPVNTDMFSSEMASFLIIYELFICSALCFCLPDLLPKSENVKLQYVEMKGTSAVYILFSLAALFVYLLYGRGSYNFFLLRLGEIRASRVQSSLGVIGQSVVDYGLSFFTIVLIYHFYKSYRKERYRFYVILAAAVACVRICIIPSSSESRFAIVALFITYALLLSRLFPEYRKIVVMGVISAGFAVVGGLTIYKTFKAFLYTSYSDAIANGFEGMSLSSVASMLDVNFYGLRDVSRNLYVSDAIHIPASTLIYDLLRNTFGIHVIVRNRGVMTTELYNRFIYAGRESSGNLFSSIAYGYVYFKALLAPLATACNIAIAARLEQLARRSIFVEDIFILSSVLVRFAFMAFSCFPMIWNYASRTLVIGFMITGGAGLFNREHISSKVLANLSLRGHSNANEAIEL